MSKLIQYLAEHFSWPALLLLIGGLTFLYTAFFIYEDEEGKIQNRLEEWWCRLDDAANKALNVHLRIIQLFARHAAARTEVMFGRRLISYQSIGVGICWGMVSAKLTVVVLGLTSGNPPVGVISGMLFGCLAFWYLSKRPNFMRMKHSVWLGFIVILWVSTTLSAYSAGTAGNRYAPLPAAPVDGNVRIVRLGIAVIPLYTWGVIISIFVSILFIAILRRTLHLITRSNSNTSVLTATILQCCFLLPLISLHLFAFKALRDDVDFRRYIFQIITPVMSYAYYITMFLILMLAHIIFWGVMQRPIYLLARLGIDRRRKLFAGVGFTMLGLAVPNVAEAAKTLGIEFIKSVLG